MGRPRSWTDDQLRTAVRASRSMKEVVDRLRAIGGAGYDAVRRRIVALDLDTRHFVRGFGRGAGTAWTSRRWCDADLATAVTTSTSLNQVFAALGLTVGGSQWLAVQETIEHLQLDTSHWTHPLPLRRSAPAYDDDQLRRAVADSTSMAGVLRRLGLAPGGARQTRLKERVEELSLDTSHMRGQGWARGRTNPAGRPRRPLSEILVDGRPVSDTSRLRRRLIEEDVKEHRCEGCGRSLWRDGPIPLELDHVNGDRRDNRLANLRILCPNCHALTDTYRGRNVGRYDARPTP